MTISQTIKEIIENLPGYNFTFLSADKSEQNLFDDIVFPIAYLDFPIESNDTLHKSGSLTAEYTIKILFGMKSELDWFTDKHETDCIEPMRNAARKFITAMQLDSRIKEVKSSKRLDVKNIFDVNMSGCILTITFTVADSNSICV